MLQYICLKKIAYVINGIWRQVFGRKTKTKKQNYRYQRSYCVHNTCYDIRGRFAIFTFLHYAYYSLPLKDPQIVPKQISYDISHLAFHLRAYGGVTATECTCFTRWHTHRHTHMSWTCTCVSDVSAKIVMLLESSSWFFFFARTVASQSYHIPND